MTRVASLTLLLFLVVAPPGTDLSGQTHLWFESLYNRQGGHCCGEADCHVLDDSRYRSTPSGGWEIEIRDGEWETVDPVLYTEKHSIFPHAVACWNATTLRLFCFTRVVDV